jgi:hypothetical protein
VLHILGVRHLDAAHITDGGSVGTDGPVLCRIVRKIHIKQEACREKLIKFVCLSWKPRITLSSTVTPSAFGKHERPGGIMSVHQQSTIVGTRYAIPPEVALAVLFLAVTAPSIAFLLFIKAPLILPSLSLISLGLAGLVALAAWTTSATNEGRHITLWDVSGAYALVGFAAGMLSEPMQVVELISLPTDPSAEAR